MIFTKATSWFQKQLETKNLSKPRLCYIQDVVDFEKSVFILTDGFHFIFSIFEKGSFFEMIQNFSLESLEIKGSILLLQEYRFINYRNRLELRITKCTYLGEGSLSSDTKDINRIYTAKNSSNSKALESSKVCRYIDQNYIQTQKVISKHAEMVNQNKKEIIEDISVSFEENLVFTNSDSCCNGNFEKQTQKNIITESYIQSLGAEDENTSIEINSSFFSHTFNCFTKSLPQDNPNIFNFSAQTALFDIQNKCNSNEHCCNDRCDSINEKGLNSHNREASLISIDHAVDINSEGDISIMKPENPIENILCNSKPKENLVRKGILSDSTNSQEIGIKTSGIKYSQAQSQQSSNLIFWQFDLSSRIQNETLEIQSQGKCKGDCNTIVDYTENNQNKIKLKEFYPSSCNSKEKTDSIENIEFETSKNTLINNLDSLNSGISKQKKIGVNFRKFRIDSQDIKENSEKVLKQMTKNQNVIVLRKHHSSRRSSSVHSKLQDIQNRACSLRKFINNLKKTKNTISINLDDKKTNFVVPIVKIKNTFDPSKSEIKKASDLEQLRTSNHKLLKNSKKTSNLKAFQIEMNNIQNHTDCIEKNGCNSVILRKNISSLYKSKSVDSKNCSQRNHKSISKGSKTHRTRKFVVSTQSPKNSQEDNFSTLEAFNSHHKRSENLKNCISYIKNPKILKKII